MGLDSKQLVRVYVARLVNSMVPIEFGTAYIQSITNDILSVALQSKDQPFIYDINQILDSYKKVFLSAGKTNEWIKFSNIVSRIATMKSTDQVKRYLVFLATLNGININNNHELSSSSGMDQLTSTNLRSSAANFDSSPFRKSNGLTMEDIIKPYYDVNTEDQILEYLPYVLQGLDSKLLNFKLENDEVLVEIPSEINTSYSMLLAKILEPALIYVKLRDFISNNSIDRTPVKLSFLTVIEEELSSYSIYVSNIFQLGSNTLTKVYNKLYPLIFKLRLLYSLTNQLNLSGFDFLQRVYKLTKFGDLDIADTATEIFSKISTEYYETLESWIIYGELIDHHKEFFIEFDTTSQNLQDIIIYNPHKVPSFFIATNSNIGYKIFQIGKILIFLEKYCKELSWVNQYTRKYDNFIHKLNSGLKLMDINLINKLIDNQYSELVNYLTYVIYEKYDAVFHLTNLRKFMLMASNDFIDAILLKGQDTFPLPSNQLTPSQLSRILVDSINFSSVKNYSAETKRRLDARILNLSHGNIGWEVFTVEYKVQDLPLDVFFSYKDGNLEYLKIFNFLWKIKYINSLINDNYVTVSNLSRNELRILSNQKKSYLVKSLKLTNIFRNRIIKFLNLLLEYVLIEIENNYQQLLAKVVNTGLPHDDFKLSDKFRQQVISSNFNIPEVNNIAHNVMEVDFDEFLTLNLTYVRNFNFKLTSGKLIGKSGEVIITQIYLILESVVLFIHSDKQFIDLISHYISLLNLESSGPYVNEIEDDIDDCETRLRKIIGNIQREIYPNFIQAYDVLAKDLRSDIDLKEFGKLF